MLWNQIKGISDFKKSPKMPSNLTRSLNMNTQENILEGIILITTEFEMAKSQNYCIQI